MGVSAREEQPDQKRILTSKIMSEITEFETGIKKPNDFKSMTSNVLGVVGCGSHAQEKSTRDGSGFGSKGLGWFIAVGFLSPIDFFKC